MMYEFLKSSDLNFTTNYKINNINKNEFIIKVYDDKNELFIFCKDTEYPILRFTMITI